MALLAIAGMAIHNDSLQASSAKTWELSQYSDFLSGKFTRIALDREGRLLVAPDVTTIHETDQSVIWSIVEGKNNTVYFGTGHQGAVYAASGNARAELRWKAPEIEVFAMALGPDGLLYVGTSPSGKVYRLGTSGDGEVFFDPGETYIWSLVFDRDGGLLVGTGDQGKVYRVDRSGNGEVWFDSKQRHVMSLALDNEGRLLAGTDPAGILYRVDGKASAFALYDSDLPEIRSVAPARDGSIYFAAMGGGMDSVVQSVQAQVAAQPQVAVAGATPIASPQASSTISYAQPTISYGLERSAVMRLQPGQAVEKLWSSTEENILGLLLKDADGSKAVFASDRYGRIYEVDSRRRLSIVAQTDQPQITAMLNTAEGMLLGSAHGGNLFRFPTARSKDGVFESAVHDSSGISQWGRLTWRGSTADGSSIEIRTRSGNSYRPDETWSPWSAPITQPEGALIASPAGRFIQWQATLAGESVLDSVRLTYLPQNSRPVVRSITVLPEAGAPAGASSAAAATTDTTSTYSITVSAAGDVTPPTTGTKATELGAGNQTKLAVSWKAEDPDGDNLRAEVAFRGEDENAWKTIKREIAVSKYSIDSDALADGRYYFRVRVDDGGVNPAARALSDEKISDPVVIDHTPPRISVSSSDSDTQVQFDAVDAISGLSAAHYAIDAGDWRPLNADDGVIDSEQESFTVTLGELGEGEHLIVFRVRDRAGNVGLGKTLRSP